MSDQKEKIKKEHEYLLVTDKDSEVILSTPDRFEAMKIANKIRRAGGEVTIFRATEM